MSDAEEDAGGLERDVPSRVHSFHATVEKAIEKGEKTGSWSRRFSSSDVQRWADADLPDRTLRRAMKDAEALGWVEKERQKWVPGERADHHAPEPEPTPSGRIGRANPDDAWHLLVGGRETMCGTEIDFFRNDDAEEERIDHFGDEDSDVLAVDLCKDCLGF